MHLEITNLVLPGPNDSSEEVEKMCLWIKENLGADAPLHFFRFWPQYKLSNLAPTPGKRPGKCPRHCQGAGRTMSIKAMSPAIRALLLLSGLQKIPYVSEKDIRLRLI